ncbi:unnamed protein product [Rangifer tarandus platyrhynchus]|uniref:ATP synthase F0 subunit 8 n=1 Tax=Rangifer tarandus platyrhynchus TaxID=3082113 RepID=A0ABN8ZCG7_RANTA|nr:unnamed protein product [Rangifer tarandus platyrhynchus]
MLSREFLVVLNNASFYLKELCTAIYESLFMMFVLLSFLFFTPRNVCTKMQRTYIASAFIRALTPGTSYIKCIKTGICYQLLYFVYRIFINCMLQNNLFFKKKLKNLNPHPWYTFLA